MISEVELRLSIRQEKREYLVVTPEEFSAITKKPEIARRHIDHLRKSRRLRGDIPLAICDGQGSYLWAILSSANKLELVTKIEQVEPRGNLVILMQALIREKNAEWLVQKCTELGVGKIIFFKGDFSSAHALNFRRIALIVENAMMQSLNFFRPVVEFAAEPLGGWCFPSPATLFYGAVDPVESQAQILALPSPLIFINGPEGGFSPCEFEWLTQYALPLRLSEQVLRSETAAICGVFRLKALTL